jgi:MerR family transcriptional regulator/heat shock protein HspR
VPGRLDPQAPASSFIDDPAAALYTVGQVASMLGVQHAFLRRLDTEQVVQPARSTGGQRRYSRNEIDRIERVTTLVGEGLSLASIRRIAELEAEVERLRGELTDARARRRR